MDQRLSDFLGGVGISGYSGKSGYSGISGYSGQGLSGYSGIGTSGFSGYSGATSTSGFSGTSGTSGFSGIGISGYSGAIGPAGGTTAAKYNILGPLAISVGTMRWYPDRTVTITSVYFSLGSSGSTTTMIDLLKNGASILQSKPSAAAGQYRSTTQIISEVLLTNDYLTVDVTQVGTGAQDAVLCIVYL